MKLAGLLLMLIGIACMGYVVASLIGLWNTTLLVIGWIIAMVGAVIITASD